MKRHFLQRSVREKVLLLAFMALVAATWWTNLASRTQAVVAEWRSLLTEREVQRAWFGQSDAIAARAATAMQQLEPARTLNGPRLVAELNAMAAKSGLTAEAAGLRSETAGRFAFHSVQLSFRRAELAKFVSFYADVTQRSPYLGVERFNLSVDRGATDRLNIMLEMVAPELSP